MRNFILILLFQFVIPIAVSQPMKKSKLDTNETGIANYGVYRYPRALNPPPPPCNNNQYFDEEEGRCLGVIGGGKALYVNNATSCGKNVLKRHCSNPKYYYICMGNKTILAQCPKNRHFESSLKKCVLVPSSEYVPVTTEPSSHALKPERLPGCEEPGSFLVPGDCSLFYTCVLTGSRMYQTFYRCPKDMAYDSKTEMCSPSNTCKESKLPPACVGSGRKENKTLEEAENLPPKVASKMFTVQTNGSTVSCETMYMDKIGSTTVSSEETTTANSEKSTTAVHDNADDVMVTTTLLTEPLVFNLAASDNNGVASTTERASEESRSWNTDDPIASTSTYTTQGNTYETETNSPAGRFRYAEENEQFSGTTTPKGILGQEYDTTVMKEVTQKTIVEGGTTPVNAFPMILIDTATTNNVEQENTEIVTENNTTPIDVSPMVVTDATVTNSVEEKNTQGVTQEANVEDNTTPTSVSPTILIDTITTDNAEQENTEGVTEVSSSVPWFEVGTTGEPILKEQYSTATPKKLPEELAVESGSTTVPPLILANLLASNTEGEGTADSTTTLLPTIVDSSDPLFQTTIANEPNLKNQDITTEEINKISDIEISTTEVPLSTTVAIIIDKPFTTETSFHEQTSEVTSEGIIGEKGDGTAITAESTEQTTTAPGIFDTSTILPDPSIDNFEAETEATAEAGTSEALLETTTPAELILNDQNSGIQETMQENATPNINEKPEQNDVTTEMEVTVEAGTNEPLLETTAPTDPISNDQNNETQETVLNNVTPSVYEELEGNDVTTEMEVTVEAGTNEPLLETTAPTEPISNDQDNETQETVLNNVTPSVYEELEGNDVTTEMEVTVEAGTNEPLLETTAPTEPISNDQNNETQETVLNNVTPSVYEELEGNDVTTEMEVTVEAGTNEPLLETTAPTEPISNDQDNETQETVLNDVTPSVYEELERNDVTTEMEVTVEAGTNESLLETTAPTEPISNDQDNETQETVLNNITPSVYEELEENDVTTEMEVTVEAGTNEPLLETTAPTDPISNDQNNETQETVLNNVTPSVYEELEENDVTTEMEVTVEAGTNEPLLEATTLTEPISNDQDNETQETVLNDVTPSVYEELEENVTTEMEVTVEAGTNEPLLETTTSTGPISNDQNNETQETVLSNVTPSVYKKLEQKDVTTEMEVTVEAGTNEPLLEITTPAETILNNQNNETQETVQDNVTPSINEEMEQKNEEDITTEFSAEDATTTASLTTTINQNLISSIPQVLGDAFLNINEEPNDLYKTTTTDPTDFVNTEREILLQTTQSNIQETAIEVTGSTNFVPTNSENKSEYLKTDSYDPVFLSSTDSPNQIDTMPNIADAIDEFNKTMAEIEQMIENMTPSNIVPTETVIDEKSGSTRVPPADMLDNSFISEITTSNVPSAAESTFLVNNPSETTSTTPIVNKQCNTSPVAVPSVQEANDLMNPNDTSTATTENVNIAINSNENTENVNIGGLTQDLAAFNANVPNNESGSLITHQNELSTTVRTTTSLEELLALCRARVLAEINDTKAIESYSTGSKSSHKHSQSQLTDNGDVSQRNRNIAGEESASAPKQIQTGRTISKNVALPFASAVLNITDDFERRVREFLRRVVLRSTYN